MWSYEYHIVCIFSFIFFFKLRYSKLTISSCLSDNLTSFLSVVCSWSLVAMYVFRLNESTKNIGSSNHRELLLRKKRFKPPRFNRSGVLPHAASSDYSELDVLLCRFISRYFQLLSNHHSVIRFRAATVPGTVFWLTQRAQLLPRSDVFL